MRKSQVKTRTIKVSLNKKNIQKLPSFIGVYIFEKSRRPRYVGKSVNVKARLLSHLENARLDSKEAAIVRSSDSISYIQTDSEFKALLLEAKLIQTHHPRYNTRWKDNKSYLYIKVTTRDPYPKIYPTRREQDKNSLYFGPFPSVQSVYYILREIRKIFPFCMQKKLSKKACFYSKMGLCDPCPNKISHISDLGERGKLRKLYLKNLKQVVKILQGKTRSAERGLLKKVKEFSDKQDYENALAQRNRLYLFQKLIEQQLHAQDTSVYMQQELALDSLTTLLKEYFPRIEKLHRIEGFDVSSLSQKYATASMVVLEDGQIAKNEYKKFHIKNPSFKSDLQMLKEALERRIRNAWPLPDLLVVDGGSPQVVTVLKVIKEKKLAIPVVGIAKHPDRLVFGVEGIPRVKPKLNNPGFNLIRLLRDESHRFARKYHLFLRGKKLLSQ